MTAVRGAAALVDGDQKALGAVDPLAFEQLVDIDVQEGDFQALADGGIFVHKDPAEGPTTCRSATRSTLTFQNGTELELPVAGIYADASIAGNWLISLDTLDQASPSSTSRDFLVAAKLAEGVTPEEGDAAVEAAMAAVPAGQGRDQRRVPRVAGGPDQPAAGGHHRAAGVLDHHRRARASRSRWRSACSSGPGRSA